MNSNEIKSFNEGTVQCSTTIFSNNKRCQVFSFVRNANVDRLTVGVKDNNEDLGLGSEDPCRRLNTESDTYEHPIPHRRWIPDGVCAHSVSYFFNAPLSSHFGEIKQQKVLKLFLAAYKTANVAQENNSVPSAIRCVTCFIYTNLENTNHYRKKHRQLKMH